MALFMKEQFLKDISVHRSAIMGISIIAILLFHQDFVSSFPLNIFHYFGYWGVDVFLLLSGMGLVNSLHKYPIRIFYRRRLLRLLPSCFFCGIIKCFTFLVIGTFIIIPNNFNFINGFSLFSLDLWFIRAILVYYLLSPWLHKYLLEKTSITMTFVIILFLINELFFRVHESNSPTWILERLLVFTIGMLLTVKQNIISPKSIFIALGFLTIACTLAAIHKGDIFGNAIPWAIMMFALAFGTMAIIYIIIMIFKHIPLVILLPFRWIGAMSLELYLIHEFVFKIVKITTIDYLSNMGRLIVGIILSLLLAFLCKLATNKVTILKDKKWHS